MSSGRIFLRLIATSASFVLMFVLHLDLPHRDQFFALTHFKAASAKRERRPGCGGFSGRELRLVEQVPDGRAASNPEHDLISR